MSAAVQQPASARTRFSDWPLRFVARITLQLRTPVVIHSGLEGGVAPTDFVRDANGLPALPGTSLCGIFRHAWTEHHRLQGESAEVAATRAAGIFGTAADTDGSASRLTLSWAHIHDSADRPVDGLLAPRDPRLGCPVLAEARIGSRRQRIRIGRRGHADGRGKFEEVVGAPGHRFSFEMMLRGDESDTEAWNNLLHLLHSPDLRLGAGTRRGFGAFTVQRLRAAWFDLRNSADFVAFSALPARLDVPTDLPCIEAGQTVGRPRVAVTLRGLRPTTPWLFGGGNPEGDEAIAPVAETVIRWHGDRGERLPQPVHYIPATGLKGALAHRLAWHYNRITGRRADTGTPEGAMNEAVACLLGHIQSRNESGDASSDDESPPGRRGLLLLDDIALSAPAASQEVQHVSLDRFSGGARSGLLFSERVLDPASLQCDYQIVLLPPLGGPPIAESIRHAFAATLEDIRKGRLAFGGGASRGNGRFRCDAVEWSDAAEWLETGKMAPQVGAGPRDDR